MIVALLLSLVSAAPSSPHRVLVLDIEAVGVEAKDAAAATRVVAAAASDTVGVEVISADDIRRLAALEADRSAAGCSSDASCLADIAGALGAEKVLFGSLSKLGSTTTAALSLYTAADGRVERASVDVNDLSHLSASLRTLVTKLLGPSTSAPPLEPVTPSPSSSPWFGVVVGGGVGVVVGAATAGVSELLIEQPERDGGEKELVRVVGVSGLVVSGLGAAALVVGVVAGGME